VADDQSVSTPEDTPVAITLTAADVPADTLTYSVPSPPSSGTLSGTPPNLTYTPYFNYHGPDSFRFVANDGQVDSNSATISITVSPVNDPPAPLPDAYTVEENSSLNFDPKANDTDVDGTFAIVQVGDLSVPGNDLGDGWVKTSYGAVKLELDNSVTYRPDQNYEGPDTDIFPYVIRDNDGVESGSSITVTIDGYLPDWDYIGLLDPWQPPSGQPYTIKLGSAFPVRWQYADPTSGEAIDSSGALPEVRLRSGINCQTGEEINGLETILTPGNSTYQYDDKRMIHQLNVDTDNLEVNECYNVYTYSGLTRQLDGPYIFKMKK
jgi:hypothetical protein